MILSATQVVEEAQAVGSHCNIKASVWTGEGPNAVQANAYRTAGQLVVSTPGRIAQALESGLIQTSLLSRTLSMFVLDEADLLLLHEYEGDLQAIAPQVSQSVSRSVSQSVREFTVIGGQLAHLTKLQLFISKHVCLCLSGTIQAGMRCPLCMHTVFPANYFPVLSRECMACMRVLTVCNPSVLTARNPCERIEVAGVFAFAMSDSSVSLPQCLDGICKANRLERSAVSSQFLPVLLLGLPTALMLYHRRSCYI